MSQPTFWHLTCPDYESDYRYTYINGQLEHPFRLPGIACELCGQTWGGSRILTIPCPDVMQRRKELGGWPISGSAHKALRDEVAAAIRERGCTVDDLCPGDAFQPGFLDVPSKPEADFLWASLGSVVVSARIKQMLEDIGATGITFCPVILRKVGKRSARLPPPIPDTGEPEDMFNDTRLTAPRVKVGTYFEMVVTAESARPSGVESLFPRCRLCGRDEYHIGPLESAMRSELWRGDDIFFLTTTLWIVVTKKIERLLVKAQATNMILKRI